MNELVDSDVLKRSFHVLQTGIRQKSKDIEIQKCFDAVESSVEEIYRIFLVLSFKKKLTNKTSSGCCSSARVRGTQASAVTLDKGRKLLSALYSRKRRFQRDLDNVRQFS